MSQKPTDLTSNTPSDAPGTSGTSQVSVRSGSSVSGSVRESDATNLLKTITEASHDTNSSQPSGIIETNGEVDGPKSWWPWSVATTTGDDTANGAKLVQVSSIQPSISQREEDTWGNYFSSYKDTVVGYVYYRDGNATETTALLAAESTSQSQDEPTDGWFWWMWNKQPDTDEEAYEEYTNDVELYKSAKSAIETTKDSINYAFKGGVSSQFLMGDNELAVSGTPSESQPVKYNIRKTPITPAEIQETTLQMVISSVNASPNKTPPHSSSNSVRSDISPDLDKMKLKLGYVIPDIKLNFRTITWITSVRLLGEKLLFQHNTSESHLYSLTDGKIKDKKLHKVKKVVIISIHSFLPSKFVKSMIGTTTGNSIQFTEQATKAVEKWLNSSKESGFENMYSIETISLEGQGTIGERVAKSLRLLENWLDLINDCDFLYVAGHSQGAIIGIHLLAQMMQNSHFKVGGKKMALLSMAGPLNGLIKNLDSKIVVRAYTARENQLLNELIQLQNSDSEQSVTLRNCIDELISNNVKITVSGSINDQLVPLESSLANSFYHPNIYRCVYVDKDCTLPPFIVTLWKMILISRNVGHLEHGIVKEISDKCLGTVTDGGYNKMFQDPYIYETSIKFALETTDLHLSRPLKVIDSEHDISTSIYKLPWSVRELVHDILQTKHITSFNLVQELVKNYQIWPDTKHWKEIKMSLEGLAYTDFDDLIM